MKHKHIAITGAAFAAATLLSASAFAQTTMSTMPSRIPNPTTSTSSQMSTKSSGVALSSISNAKQKLASASVKDSSGQTLGQVQKVKTTASGAPTAIEVNLTSAPSPKIVQIPASQLRYDQSSNMLMTVGLSATEVDSMPAVSNP
ncbi:MAG: hypothetical protein ACTHLR_00625 [Rhizomicrobium sp.]